MSPSTTVVDVLIVRQMERGWVCEIEGRPTFLDKEHIAPGTRMPSEGRRGLVMITMTAASSLGLAVPRAARPA